MLTRPSKRNFNELRKIILETKVSPYAEGSCLAKFGNTHVICTASVETKLPPWLRNSGKGWVTAEYGMLPRCTHSRMDREVSKGKASGRTHEIQRLIGRSLRSIIDLKKLGEFQIKIDCDVIQADGGTRTASITGAWVALYDAVSLLLKSGKIAENPIFDQIGVAIENLATQGALSFKTFAAAALSSISEVIGALIKQGVTAAVANAFKNPAGIVPGVGLALAGLAGAGASALFKGLISKKSQDKLTYQALSSHFDRLIREAVVDVRNFSTHIRSLIKR